MGGDVVTALAPPVPAGRVDEILAGEVVSAWREYLDDTRSVCEVQYGEVEPSAWARLQHRLEKVAHRRALLEAARP